MPVCSGCNTAFSQDEFIEHAQIVPIGMQFIDRDLKHCMYYFNHTCPHCGSTILLPVSDFLPFIDEKIPDSVLTGTEVCEQHCLHIADLQECKQECHYAAFRRFLLKMLAKNHRVENSTAT